MEEMFEGIVALIVIVVIGIAKGMGQTKKLKQNAPGKAAAPVRPAAPARTAPARPTVRMPAAPSIQPTVRPVGGNMQLGSFWQQVSSALQEQDTSSARASGHEAPVRMPEGDSRECEHGSVGGSMAYQGHQEGREDRRERKTATGAYDNPASDALYRPAMNAQEMRQAVVMAEILKRPQERMAEQARRWTVR